MKINPVRDTLSVGFGMLGFIGLGYPLGLVGTAAKKGLIREGDSFGKRFLVGLAATLISAGTGLIPYLLATPGLEAQKEVQAARKEVAEARYQD